LVKQCEQRILAINRSAARSQRGHGAKATQQNEDYSTRCVTTSGKNR
jgi:hypothetical protein